MRHSHCFNVIFSNWPNLWLLYCFNVIFTHCSNVRLPHCFNAMFLHCLNVIPPHFSMPCFHVVSTSYYHIVSTSYFYIVTTSDCHIVFFFFLLKKTSFIQPFFSQFPPFCRDIQPVNIQIHFNFITNIRALTGFGPLHIFFDRS